MNIMNEFDLQFKIFTLTDTTKSYIILNESMNKLLSVRESIVLMGYAFYETSFNNPTVKHVCVCFKIIYAKNYNKQTFIDQVKEQKFSTVIKQKITI